LLVADDFGTSVVGPQKLISDVERLGPFVVISFLESLREFPIGVGYYYICLMPNFQDPESVYAKGVLYQQGVVVAPGRQEDNDLRRLSVYVYWQKPGLNWTVFY
jgi:hypothetical protein